MAVVNVDPGRFDAKAPASENAGKQRIEVSKLVVAGKRPAQPDNGDVALADKRGTFTKGLVHDPATGLVDPGGFGAFLAALGQPRDKVFAEVDKLTAVQGAGASTRKWVDPAGGRAFAVVGGDPQQYEIPPAPKFGSPELSFEILENYWMALLRDVPFARYASSPLAAAAAKELTAFHKAAKPKQPLVPVDGNGDVTPELLFRGLTAGDRVGPYVSQFLLHPVPFGVQGFHQRNRTLLPGQDFITEWREWLWVQNGAPRSLSPSHFDPELHYLRNGRDLSQWVHVDVLFQGYFNACLQLLQDAGAPSSVGGGIGNALPAQNPYRNAKTQEGFGTLGGPEQIATMCEVAPLALRAIWFQKWFVHLRMRPEVYGARVQYELDHAGFFGLPADLLGSDGVGRTLGRYGTALLPQAFPEGSPMHPSYGAGHATVAGACVTILKALFDGSVPFPNPVDVLVDGSGAEHLVPFGGPLTVEGELNKLASNVALGRNIAGVHWRSDGTESLKLGEQVAIDLLCAYASSYAEVPKGAVVFSFTRFDGTLAQIKREV